MHSAPGGSASTSSRPVCGFMQTIRSTSFLRAIQPSLFARMVNHVGRPAMFEGNMFLPLTGTPIWKMERMRTLFDDWEPEPLTVATWMVRSLTIGAAAADGSSSTAVAVSVSDTTFSLLDGRARLHAALHPRRQSLLVLRHPGDLRRGAAADPLHGEGQSLQDPDLRLGPRARRLHPHRPQEPPHRGEVVRSRGGAHPQGEH